jgi:altronate hydrolase
VKYLNAQDSPDELEEGARMIGELQKYADSFKRQEVPVSKLTVGLKCGGSDGYSGITANPLVGRFSDRLIACGGSTVLTEVPEMFGAEALLMERCENREVFDKTVRLINNFKEYFKRHNQVIYENPSPGNKAGGITTLEEKSLGCVQKGGKSAVVDVLDIGEPVTRTGLNLLNGPGNDIVATTNLTASGAHLILFTTGRGTPVGAPVPTVKIASNSRVYESKRRWIDFNAGQLLEGKSMDEVDKQLFDYILRVASGEQTRNEINGYKEISIFKDGIIL